MKNSGKYAQKKSPVSLWMIVVMLTMIIVFTIGILFFVQKSNGRNVETQTYDTAYTTEEIWETQVTTESDETVAMEQIVQAHSTSTYSLNGIEYTLPVNWTVKSSSERMAAYRIDGNEMNLLIVESEDIPAIMKIDVGGNSILNKEDIANHYGINSSIDCTVTSQAWTNGAYYDYCDTLFSSNAKLTDGTPDLRTGRSVVFAYNENSSVFAISILSYNSSDLSYLDTMVTEAVSLFEKNSPVVQPASNLVEAAYNTACSLSIDQLDKKYSSFSGTTSYYYGELIIQNEDVEWLNSSRNTNKTLNQGALYRTIAKYLAGYSMKLNNGSAYCEILTGKQWIDNSTFEPLAKNAATFIVTDATEQLKSIMRKFQSLQSVTGQFDFEAGKLGKYTFDIPDLTKCAEEMQISEEMLGYIFALLDEFAPSISFNENNVHFEYAS